MIALERADLQKVIFAKNLMVGGALDRQKSKGLHSRIWLRLALRRNHSNESECTLIPELTQDLFGFCSPSRLCCTLRRSPTNLDLIQSASGPDGRS